MRRWTFHLLAGVSLLLLLATLAMWVMSYGIGSRFARDREVAKRDASSYCALVLNHGSFFYTRAWVDSGFISSGKPEVVLWNWENLTPFQATMCWPEESSHHFAGFGYTAESSLAGERRQFELLNICVPAWSQSLVLSILPACWLVRDRRARRRLREGYCPCCGYDLGHARALPGMRIGSCTSLNKEFEEERRP